METFDEAIWDGLCRCGCKKKPSKGYWWRGHGGAVKTVKAWSSDWYTVTDCGHPTPCWIWNGYKDKERGYGKTRWKNRTFRAHIRSWLESGREIDDGMQLDHLCRQTACVNPDHLEQVTPTENMRRGSRTKLKIEQVREIRARYATGEESQEDLAQAFGVRQSNIWYIVTERTWKDI